MFRVLLKQILMSNTGFRQFTNVCVFAITGIVTGIILGFVFGALITLIVQVLPASANETPPLQLGTFLGMGVGSVVGGIFGGVIGYKK